MIRVTALTRYYGTFAALDNVSFTVQNGTILGLLGRNGAGKSTTLKILAGLLPPSSGQVEIDGVDVVASPETLRTAIGYLPETPPLYDDMTIQRFIEHMGTLRGLSRTALRTRVPIALKAADLEDRANQLISTLSHGYRKRVGIAQAIVHDPKLVILDEPISGLDPTQIAEMRTVIRRLATDRVVMISSHILSEVERTCDQIVVLDAGKLVAEGREEDLATSLTLDLELRGTQEAIRAFFAARTDVQEVAVQAQGEVIKVTLSLPTDTREALARDLIAAGFGLLNFTSRRGLEALFERLTTKEAA